MAKKKAKSKVKKKASKQKFPKSVSVLDLDPPRTPSNPLWIDSLQVQTRKDGIVILVFESAIPDHNMRSEACRVAMNTDQAKRVTDLLTRLLNHYPTPQP